MPERVVGRDDELAAVDRFASSLRDGPRALLFEGPPGIGKSVVFGMAVKRLAASGVRTLVARPSGAEATYAYQGLADLLAPIPVDGAGSLPRVQRTALDVALLRGAPEAAADPHVVSMAVTGLVRALATDGPLVIAIDDAPWLDPATARVLTFATRRISGRPVGVLLTRRVDESGSSSLELDATLPIEQWQLEPLGLAALHLMLAEHLGLTLPRQTLLRLQAMSGGNPLHALEIGRALRRLPTLPGPGEPLPIPESIRGLVDARLASLPASARAVLLAVAASGRSTVAELTAALDPAAVDSGLDLAVDAGILDEAGGGRIRFAHPLLEAAAYGAASRAARRAMHARLAGIVTEPEARGRHLALASVGPDAAVADALEAAANDARRRGATATAAELMRLAVLRTPPDDQGTVGRRRVRQASLLLDAADLGGARVVIEEALPGLPPGPLRAEARMILGTVLWYLDTASAAAEQLRIALPDAARDRVLAGRIHYRLSVFESEASRAAAHAATAIDLLRDVDEPVTLAGAMFQLFAHEVAMGRPPREDLLAEGLRIEGAGTSPDKNTVPGIYWLSADRPGLAIARFQSMLDEARAAGESSGEADLLTRLGEAYVFAGDYATARAYAEESVMVAQQDGQASADPARRVLALVDALEGRLDQAEGVSEAGLRRTEAAHELDLAVAYLRTLVIVAITRGAHDEVVRLAARAHAHFGSMGWREPGRLDVTADEIEALVALGRLDEAAELLNDLDLRGRTFLRPTIDAQVVRARALLAFAKQDWDAAVGATEAVLEPAATAWPPFERARTFLVRGQVLRQRRSRREAGIALDEARSLFARLGASGWLARTDVEISRLGLRRGSPSALTPSEERVAELAASGLRNHEVAAAMAISPKTVEAHLARIYAKLEIRSRAELGRAMAGRGETSAMQRDSRPSPDGDSRDRGTNRLSRSSRLGLP